MVVEKHVVRMCDSAGSRRFHCRLVVDRVKNLRLNYCQRLKDNFAAQSLLARLRYCNLHVCLH